MWCINWERNSKSTMSDFSELINKEYNDWLYK